MLQAGGQQAYTHTYRALKWEQGQDNINFIVFSIQMKAWYERQTGQDRQSGHFLTGVSEQRPNGIFSPVNIVQVLPGEGCMLYYLSRLP
jgi:hypothetical protein